MFLFLIYILRRMGNSTYFAYLLLLTHFISYFLKNLLIQTHNTNLWFLPKTLDNDRFSGQFLKRNCLRSHDVTYSILRWMMFLIHKKRNIILQISDDAHIHTGHVLLESPRMGRLIRTALASYRLAWSQFWSKDTHAQQFRYNFVVLDESWLSAFLTRDCTSPLRDHMLA